MMRTPRTAPAPTPPHRAASTGHRPLRTVVRRFSPATAAVAVLALATLSGCMAENGQPATVGTPAPSTADPVTITDPWVKTAASGTTAAFGTLTNNTDREITVVSGTSPVAKTVELHEVALVGGTMAMRPKVGGFVIPPRGRHQLKPGGDHLMLLAVTAAVRPGDQVPVTLRLGDGATVAFTAVAKDFAGANESYQPDGQASPGTGRGPSTSPGTGRGPGGHG